MKDMNCKFQIIAEWNHEIHKNALFFHTLHNFFPNIILTNEATAKRLDALLSLELFEQGENNFVQGLSEFQTKLYHIQVCSEPDLEYGEFILIYDDEAEFIDPEDVKISEKKGNYVYANVAA